MFNKKHRRIMYLETALHQKHQELEHAIQRHNATKAVLEGTLKLTGTQQEEISRLRMKNQDLEKDIQIEKLRSSYINDNDLR